jgi:hypothetical protein
MFENLCRDEISKKMIDDDVIVVRDFECCSVKTSSERLLSKSNNSGHLDTEQNGTARPQGNFECGAFDHSATSKANEFIRKN